MQIKDLLNKEYKVKTDNYADFQLLGKEIQDYCKLKFFPIFLFLNYNHILIKDAFLIIKKTDKHDIRYLTGIIKKLNDNQRTK